MAASNGRRLKYSIVRIVKQSQNYFRGLPEKSPILPPELSQDIRCDSPLVSYGTLGQTCRDGELFLSATILDNTQHLPGLISLRIIKVENHKRRCRSRVRRLRCVWVTLSRAGQRARRLV